MAKKIDINMDSIKEFFSSLPDKIKTFFEELPDKLTELWEKIITYFENITLYQQIAWGTIGLGLILLILGIVL